MHGPRQPDSDPPLSTHERDADTVNTDGDARPNEPREVDGGHEIAPDSGRVSRRALLGGAVGAAGIVALGGSTLWLGDRPSDESGDGRLGGGQASIGSGQPVTEYPLTDRGQPVELSGGTLTDDELDLADLRGEVVVINVWGSWCVPCRIEAPVLARVSQEYRERGVSFVGVNVKDNRAAAVAFEVEYGITYPSIEDTDGRAVLALSQYVPASAVPVTLVLDRDGRVAARVLGAVREATLRALLDSALAEPS